MSVNRSELRIGDTATVRGEIVAFRSHDPYPVKLQFPDYRALWVSINEILVHTRAPHAFKSGDKVLWTDYPAVEFEFIAERLGIACLWHSHGYFKEAPLRHLRHAEPERSHADESE